MTIKWENGLPKWLKDDGCEISRSRTSISHEEKYSEFSTARPDEQIVTVVYGRTFSPRCWAHDEETIDEGWAIFISREEVDSGEGDREDATLALYKILREQKIEIEE